MSRFRNLTLLKVLATVAWADGEITNSELNVLKRLYRKFGLDQSDIDEVKPYLNSPVSKKEQDTLIRQLAAEMNSKNQQKEAIQLLREMADADSQLKEEERNLLEECTRMLEKSSVSRRSFGKVRNFFKKTLFKPAREKNPEMNRYFRDVVFKKIEVKLKGVPKKLREDEDQIYFLCMLGTLLASVGHVDGNFDDNEKKVLKEVLARRYDFEPKEWKTLFEVMDEQAESGVDLYDLIKEFNRTTTYNDRLHFVECFFAIAAADGDMSHEEVEEIRRITKAMRVPHKWYIEKKMEVLNRLRG